jgi:hypothetical protein
MPFFADRSEFLKADQAAAASAGLSRSLVDIGASPRAQITRSRLLCSPTVGLK